MKKEFLLALSVYAYNEGYTNLPVTEVIEKFKADAERCVKAYIGEIMNLKTPLEFFTDFTLCYAKARVESGLSTYGKTLDKHIKNYVYRSRF